MIGFNNVVVQYPKTTAFAFVTTTVGHAYFVDVFTISVAG